MNPRVSFQRGQNLMLHMHCNLDIMIAHFGVGVKTTPTSFCGITMTETEQDTSYDDDNGDDEVDLLKLSN